jgi:hypothetical protein
MDIPKIAARRPAMRERNKWKRRIGLRLGTAELLA